MGVSQHTAVEILRLMARRRVTGPNIRNKRRNKLHGQEVQVVQHMNRRVLQLLHGVI